MFTPSPFFFSTFAIVPPREVVERRYLTLWTQSSMPSALMPAPSSQTSLPGLCSLGHHCWTPDGSVPPPSSRKLLLSSFFNRSSWSQVWLPSLVPLLSLLPQGTQELPGERPELLIKFTPSRGLEPLCSVPAYVVSPLVWAPLENTPTTATRPYMCGSQLWLDRSRKLLGTA